VVARRLEAVQKKAALRAQQTVVEGDMTVESDSPRPRRRRSMGPATLMQRLLRAQIKEMDDPGWLGRQLQKTWVLTVALVLAVGTLTMFAVTNRASRERRRWNTIEKLYQSGDDYDLAALVERLNDYLQRYPEGMHAEEARRILPDAERQRRQLEFLRSDAVKDLRPQPEPVSTLERLYRKALLQQWLEGDDAARATLEEILSRADVPQHDQFLLQLVEQDLVSLDLRRADKLRGEGQNDAAAEILNGIIEKYQGTLRYARWVRAARQALDELSRQATDPK
jgi:hypothetical protein